MALLISFRGDDIIINDGKEETVAPKDAPIPKLKLSDRIVRVSYGNGNIRNIVTDDERELLIQICLPPVKGYPFPKPNMDKSGKREMQLMFSAMLPTKIADNNKSREYNNFIRTMLFLESQGTELIQDCVKKTLSKSCLVYPKNKQSGFEDTSRMFFNAKIMEQTEKQKPTIVSYVSCEGAQPEEKQPQEVIGEYGEYCAVINVSGIFCNDSYSSLRLMTKQVLFEKKEKPTSFAEVANFDHKDNLAAMMMARSKKDYDDEDENNKKGMKSDDDSD